MKTVADFTVPIVVAIIAGAAASWNFIQAKWNGHYFQNLIIRELGELEPRKRNPEDEEKVEYGLLTFHMNKSFMHKKILDNPTENKESIFTVDNKLIYLTNQVWSAFDNNDVEQFLLNLKFISVDKRKKLKIFPMRYDWSNNISKALEKWIDLVKKPDKENNEVVKVGNKDIEITISKFWGIKGDIKTSQWIRTVSMKNFSVRASCLPYYKHAEYANSY